MKSSKNWRHANKVSHKENAKAGKKQKYDQGNSDGWSVRYFDTTYIQWWSTDVTARFFISENVMWTTF